MSRHVKFQVQDLVSVTVSGEMMVGLVLRVLPKTHEMPEECFLLIGDGGGDVDRWYAHWELELHGRRNLVQH